MTRPYRDRVYAALDAMGGDWPEDYTVGDIAAELKTTNSGVQDIPLDEIMIEVISWWASHQGR